VDKLRYPIGRFTRPEKLSAKERQQAISALEEAPKRLRAAILGLQDGQLDTPYRPDGWTVRQLVHHMPDSHLNAYTRLKLALTENEPTIRPYEEKDWAELPEARTAPVEVSLDLFEALHARWALALRALAPEEWQRKLRHPDMGPMSVDTLIALYAWHGRHHVAHINGLRQREGWL
jgi:uncharacterized damage-inducible protein DinB